MVHLDLIIHSNNFNSISHKKGVDMKKYAIILLPQLILATTVGTDIKMEGLRPILEINVQPHKNVSLNTKTSFFDMVEQNIEGKYKINEYVEVNAEVFVGYEQIKEYKELDKLIKSKNKVEDLKGIKKDIETESDISKIIENTRKLKDDNEEVKEIKGLLNDKVTRKDAYTKLLSIIKGRRVKTTIEQLETAINSNNLEVEVENIVKVMNYVKGPSNSDDVESGLTALKESYDIKTGVVDNSKMQVAFEKFYSFFSKGNEYQSIKEEFNNVSKLYAEEVKGTGLKKVLTDEIGKSIEKLNGEIKNIEKNDEKIIKHHIYYGTGIGANVNYMNFEAKLKGRIGASTYITKENNKPKSETTLYWSIDSGIRYNWRINKFNIVPELGVKYVWAKYGQKGFVPYGSVGFDYRF